MAKSSTRGRKIARVSTQIGNRRSNTAQTTIACLRLPPSARFAGQASQRSPAEAAAFPGHNHHWLTYVSGLRATRRVGNRKIHDTHTGATVHCGQARYMKRVVELTHFPIFLHCVHNWSTDPSLGASPSPPRPGSSVRCIGDNHENIPHSLTR